MLPNALHHQGALFKRSPHDDEARLTRLNPRLNGCTFLPLKHHHRFEALSMALTPGVIACVAQYHPNKSCPSLRGGTPSISRRSLKIWSSPCSSSGAGIEGKWVRGTHLPAYLHQQPTAPLTRVFPLGNELTRCVVRRDTSLDAQHRNGRRLTQHTCSRHIVYSKQS